MSECRTSDAACALALVRSFVTIRGGRAAMREIAGCLEKARMSECGRQLQHLGSAGGDARQRYDSLGTRHMSFYPNAFS
jgi:hypothetical protein